MFRLSLFNDDFSTPSYLIEHTRSAQVNFSTQNAPLGHPAILIWCIRGMVGCVLQKRAKTLHRDSVSYMWCGFNLFLKRVIMRGQCAHEYNQNK